MRICVRCEEPRPANDWDADGHRCRNQKSCGRRITKAITERTNTKPLVSLGQANVETLYRDAPKLGDAA